MKSSTVRTALSRRPTQAAAKLLQEQRGALGRAQEEHGVDVGQVQALVEQVGGEQHVDAAVLAGPAKRSRALGRAASPR